MSDGSASSHDDELPPDPWAGLVGPTPPPPPPPAWRPPDEDAARPPGWRSHPSVTPDAAAGHRPPPRRSVWHHPAIWFALLALAGLLLVTALLEPRAAPPTGGDPDAVTAVAVPTEAR